MKNIITSLYIFLFIIFVPVTAQSQSLPYTAPGQSLLTDQYVVHEAADRDQQWWETIEKDIHLQDDATVEEITESQIRDIIFFANLHGDKLDFSSSVPQLLEVYARHPNESYRLLAVAALHKVGDPKAMKELRKLVRKETSARVRHVTFAALNDFNQRNAK